VNLANVTTGICCAYCIYIYIYRERERERERERDSFSYVKHWSQLKLIRSSGVPRNFVRGGEFKKFSLGQDTPLVKGSGGSCNLVQEISFNIVKFS